jgi:hypothetical protein
MPLGILDESFIALLHSQYKVSLHNFIDYNVN